MVDWLGGVYRYMAKKLLCFAVGNCAEESADSPMNQELLLSGHLLLMLLKVPTPCPSLTRQSASPH